MSTICGFPAKAVLKSDVTDVSLPSFTRHLMFSVILPKTRVGFRIRCKAVILQLLIDSSLIVLVSSSQITSRSESPAKRALIFLTAVIQGELIAILFVLTSEFGIAITPCISIIMEMSQPKAVLTISYDTQKRIMYNIIIIEVIKKNSRFGRVRRQCECQCKNRNIDSEMLRFFTYVFSLKRNNKKFTSYIITQNRSAVKQQQRPLFSSRTAV